ncbi:DUF3820 family protein [Pulveribacter suum]|uniref:DUF3820 family protein n=1 Tax=Pulveribacter suum TaxID=2116657 RepID=UPI001D039A80|nr:DUF3820 family protein [Pulveribacter suum]
MDPERLALLLERKMPFGKHQGLVIADLPANYLHWFAREGFPRGEIGQLLALMYELDHNGLRELLAPLQAARRNQKP